MSLPKEHKLGNAITQHTCKLTYYRQKLQERELNIRKAATMKQIDN